MSGNGSDGGFTEREDVRSAGTLSSEQAPHEHDFRSGHLVSRTHYTPVHCCPACVFAVTAGQVFTAVHASPRTFDSASHAPPRLRNAPTAVNPSSKPRASFVAVSLCGVKLPAAFCVSQLCEHTSS
jgi:hypothetical protein